MNRVTKLYSCRVILITFITSFIVPLVFSIHAHFDDSFARRLKNEEQCIAFAGSFGTSRLHIKNDHSFTSFCFLFFIFSPTTYYSMGKRCAIAKPRRLAGAYPEIEISVRA